MLAFFMENLPIFQTWTSYFQSLKHDMLLNVVNILSNNKKKFPYQMFNFKSCKRPNMGLIVCRPLKLSCG